MGKWLTFRRGITENQHPGSFTHKLFFYSNDIVKRNHPVKKWKFEQYLFIYLF